jgi:hypothetical protein
MDQAKQFLGNIKKAINPKKGSYKMKYKTLSVKLILTISKS